MFLIDRNKNKIYKRGAASKFPAAPIFTNNE